MKDKNLHNTNLYEKDKPVKLFNRNFILLAQGYLTSTIGSEVFQIVMLLFIKSLTESGTIIGLMFAVATIPAVILGPIAGTVADRYSRKWIMVVSDLINGAAVLVLTVMIFNAGDDVGLIIPVTFFVIFLMGVTNTFFRPSMDASIPDIVPRNRLESANSISVFSNQTSLFIGQSAGSVIYSLIGAPITFLINSFAFLISSVTESFIRLPKKIKRGSDHWIKNKMNSFWKETADGLRYLLKDKGLRNFAIVNSLFNFLTAPFIIILPFFVEDYLFLTPEWVGFLIASLAVGGVIGVTIPNLIKPSPRHRYLIIGISFITTSLLISSLFYIRTMWLIVPGFVLTGVCLSSTDVYLRTVIQVNTESEMRGRIVGLTHTINAGIKPVGMALIGIIIDLLGKNIPVIFIAVGFLGLTLATLLIINKPFHKVMSYDISTVENKTEKEN